MKNKILVVVVVVVVVVVLVVVVVVVVVVVLVVLLVVVVDVVVVDGNVHAKLQNDSSFVFVFRLFLMKATDPIFLCKVQI